MFTFQADTSPLGHGSDSALIADRIVAGEFERPECATGYGNAESMTIPDNKSNRECCLVICGSPSDESRDIVAYSDRSVFLNHAELESPFCYATSMGRRYETFAAEGSPIRRQGASLFRRSANMPTPS